MNSMSLSKDDIETILINLNASKEDLCNRGLWNIAEEYQQLIYKILVNFADTLGEKVNEYVTELSPVSKESINHSCDETMKEEIRKAPTEPEQKWISVSEKLPKPYEDVLVCNPVGDMKVIDGCYSTEIPGEWMWFTTNWRFGEVIAWMPLPEPYKEAMR